MSEGYLLICILAESKQPSLTSHLASKHIKISELIRHIICESLVVIQPKRTNCKMTEESLENCSFITNLLLIKILSISMFSNF